MQRRAHRGAIRSIGTHQPFHDADQTQLLGAMTAINEPQPHLLDRRFRVDAPGRRHVKFSTVVTNHGVALAVRDAVLKHVIALCARRHAPRF